MICIEYDNIFVVEDGKEEHPSVNIHIPEASLRGDYVCLAEVNGFGQKIKKDVFGISKQQALSLAIGFVNYLILNSDVFENRKVFCEFSDGSRELLEPEMIGERDKVEYFGPNST